jgi:hypothetical protein
MRRITRISVMTLASIIGIAATYHDVAAAAIGTVH